MERLTTELCGNYVPRAFCSIGRDGEADDSDMCIGHCKGADDEGTHCHECEVQWCFDRLGIYENAQEKIEKRLDQIRHCAEYPHNCTGQIAADLECVLKLFGKDAAGSAGVTPPDTKHPISYAQRKTE